MYYTSSSPFQLEFFRILGLLILHKSFLPRRLFSYLFFLYSTQLFNLVGRR